MSLQAILQAMEAEAAQQEHDVLANARAVTEALLKEAQAQSAAVRRALQDEARASVRADQIRADADAHLRVSRTRAGERDARVSGVFARAAELLNDARTDPSYQEALTTLLREALALIPADWPAVVRCDPRDLALIAPALATAGRFVAINASLKTRGGLVVEDVQGRLSVDNTLERRLERAAELIRGDVARAISASESAATGTARLPSGPGADDASRD